MLHNNWNQFFQVMLACSGKYRGHHLLLFTGAPPSLGMGVTAATMTATVNSRTGDWLATYTLTDHYRIRRDGAPHFITGSPTSPPAYSTVVGADFTLAGGGESPYPVELLLGVGPRSAVRNGLALDAVPEPTWFAVASLPTGAHYQFGFATASTVHIAGTVGVAGDAEVALMRRVPHSGILPEPDEFTLLTLPL